MKAVNMFFSNAVSWLMLLCFVLVIVLLPCSANAYTEDFEGGAPGWTTEGTWSLITSDFHSADHCMTDSPDGDYPDNAYSSLISPLIKLPGTTPIIMYFWQYYNFYYNNGGSDDYGYVQISTDYGLSWNDLIPYFKSTVSTWQYVPIDLSAYSGQTVMIRFKLIERGSYQADGWYIDDVYIPGTEVSDLVPYYQEDFENGAQGWILEGTWSPITTDYHSPDHCMTDSPDGDYPDNAYTAIISPIISLPDSTLINLTFWQHFDFYYNNGGSDDYGYVQISTDYGLSWETLGHRASTRSTWFKEWYDLSAYSGIDVMIRFLLTERGSYQRDGWYIDDVIIETPGGSPPFKIDIKANDSNGTVVTGRGEDIVVTVELEDGEYTGTNVEWWIGALSTIGTYWYNSSGNWVTSNTPILYNEEPLHDLTETIVLDSNLPMGIYTLFFVLDTNINGNFNITPTAHDQVSVVVR